VYKVEPGGHQKLQERKHWLDDDYVKFIRFAESLVEKTEEGIVAMITAHGYVDNPTFRGMRWHLRTTFDAIYVLDLHGNSNKKETALDGSEDKNVFDIKTGVSIIFGVKKKRGTMTDKPLATVYQSDLYGKRAVKFATLDTSSIESIDWNQLPANTEAWKVEGKGKAKYLEGFSVAELFPLNTSGIVTMGDKFIIDQNKTKLQHRVEDFLAEPITEADLKEQYGLGKNYAKWVVENKQNITADPATLVPLAYRPFDNRYTYFDNKLVWRTRTEKMKHFVGQDNIGLLLTKSVRDPNYNHAFVSTNISEAIFLSGTTSTNAINLPLYLYENDEKIANLDPTIVTAIEAVVGPTVPEDILDYVYAYLHAPSYRAKFGEFLKTDFPRRPYPSDGGVFRALTEHGRHLRGLHLLTDPAVRTPITTFPATGTDTVEKLSYQSNRVYINDEQYWDGVPTDVWNFYIGGYQPAQKYLKDRKGKKLTNAEFENYEQMVVSLSETIKVMGEIDGALGK